MCCMCVRAVLRVRVSGHFFSVIFHFILPQCCWWDWCLFSNGPIITDFMALEHCSDFTGSQAVLNMNQGDCQCEAHQGCNKPFIWVYVKNPIYGSVAKSILLCMLQMSPQTHIYQHFKRYVLVFRVCNVIHTFVDIIDMRNTPKSSVNYEEVGLDFVS